MFKEIVIRIKKSPTHFRLANKLYYSIASALRSYYIDTLHYPNGDCILTNNYASEDYYIISFPTEYLEGYDIKSEGDEIILTLYGFCIDELDNPSLTLKLPSELFTGLSCRLLGAEYFDY